MGSIAAPVVAKIAPASRQSIALQEFDAAWAKLKDVCYHYTVWDSLVISPGQVVNERLLPPPCPADFLIDAIGIHVNDAADYKAVAEVAQHTVLKLKDGERNLIESVALCYFGDGMAPMRLPMRHQFQDDLGLYINSGGLPIQSESPVTISIILQGLVRKSGLTTT